MAIWKEVKKAINSTFGTSAFKPLDKIIRDSYYVYASDDLLKTLYTKPDAVVTYEIPLTDIGTVGVPGVVRLKITASGTNLHGNHLKIGKNGSVKYVNFPDGANEIVKDLEVNRNDVIQFAFSGSTTFSTYVTDMKITAHGKIGSAPDTGVFIE